MIRSIKKRKGVIATFGRGSIRVKSYLLKSRYGGQVELTQISPQKIGSEVSPDIKTVAPAIVLSFSSIDSIQVLIDKLEGLKQDLEEV